MRWSDQRAGADLEELKHHLLCRDRRKQAGRTEKLLLSIFRTAKDFTSTNPLCSAGPFPKEVFDVALD